MTSLLSHSVSQSLLQAASHLLRNFSFAPKCDCEYRYIKTVSWKSGVANGVQEYVYPSLQPYSRNIILQLLKIKNFACFWSKRLIGLCILSAQAASRAINRPLTKKKKKKKNVVYFTKSGRMWEFCQFFYNSEVSTAFTNIKPLSKCNWLMCEYVQISARR